MASAEASVVRKIAGKEIIVRELTVADARVMFMANMSDDVIGEMLFAECSLADIVRMTNLTREELDTMRPSEVKQVLSWCKEQNQDFFGMLTRLEKARSAH